jgi:hypothetical protein
MVARVTRESTDGPIPPQSAALKLCVANRAAFSISCLIRRERLSSVSASCPQTARGARGRVSGQARFSTPSLPRHADHCQGRQDAIRELCPRTLFGGPGLGCARRFPTGCRSYQTMT